MGRRLPADPADALHRGRAGRSGARPGPRLRPGPGRGRLPGARPRPPTLRAHRRVRAGRGGQGGRRLRGQRAVAADPHPPRAQDDDAPTAASASTSRGPPSTVRPSTRGCAAEGSSKYGVYADDLDVFRWLRAGAADRTRCIEAQVMDWSDDIAYSVHDLEDALVSQHLSLAQLTDPAEQAEVGRLAAARYAPEATCRRHRRGAADAAGSRVVAEHVRRLAAAAWPPSRT